MQRINLDARIISSLHTVRRVKPTDNVKLGVGSFFALDGAWDNKKQVTAIRAIEVAPGDMISVGGWQNPQRVPVLEAFEVDLQNIGKIFKDGRYKAPTRRSKPVKQTIYLVYKDGAVREVPAGSYVHVIPRKVA